MKENLFFSSRDKNAVSKYKCVKFSLFPLLYERSPISIDPQLFIVKTYIRPIVTHAGPAWTVDISKSWSWSKLEALQYYNTTLSQITRLDWYVSNDTISWSSLQILTLKDSIRQDINPLLTKHRIKIFFKVFFA